MSDQVILALTTCPDEAPAGLRSTCIWDARLQDLAGILILLAIPGAGGNERCLDWVRMGVAGKGQ